jgi:predicted TIM-barrel fold metal-dependent hydrolase
MGIPAPDHPVIDSDRHVYEPTNLWRDYLPRALKTRAPRCEGSALIFEEQSIFGPVSSAAKQIVGEQARDRMAELEAASHPEGQLRAMDRQGVDVAYLFPTLGLYLTYVDGADPELSAAMARAYNAWLFDYCAAAPSRLQGVGLICRHDPGAMLRELEWVVDTGWRAVVLRPNPIAGRYLNDSAYEPFWAACERHSIAVTFHEGTHARAPTAGADRFPTRFAQHACSHPFEQMMAFLALLEAGVFARHPALRVAFLESGASWLPFWLWRLDELCWPHMRHEVTGSVDLLPSAYFRRQCWIAIDPREPGLDLVADNVGLEHLLYGSDYPHPDHGVESVIEAVRRARTASPERLERAVLHEGPSRFFDP